MMHKVRIGLLLFLVALLMLVGCGDRPPERPLIATLLFPTSHVTMRLSSFDAVVRLDRAFIPEIDRVRVEFVCAGAPWSNPGVANCRACEPSDSLCRRCAVSASFVQSGGGRLQSCSSVDWRVVAEIKGPDDTWRSSSESVTTPIRVELPRLAPAARPGASDDGLNERVIGVPPPTNADGSHTQIVIEAAEGNIAAVVCPQGIREGRCANFTAIRLPTQMLEGAGVVPLSDVRGAGHPAFAIVRRHRDGRAEVDVTEGPDDNHRELRLDDASDVWRYPSIEYRGPIAVVPVLDVDFVRAGTRSRLWGIHSDRGQLGGSHVQEHSLGVADLLIATGHRLALCRGQRTGASDGAGRHVGRPDLECAEVAFPFPGLPIDLDGFSDVRLTTIADMDGDQVVELIIASRATADGEWHVHLLRSNEAVAHQLAVAFDGRTLTRAGDDDDDGHRDVFITSGPGEVRVLLWRSLLHGLYGDSRLLVEGIPSFPGGRGLPGFGDSISGFDPDYDGHWHTVVGEPVASPNPLGCGAIYDFSPRSNGRLFTPVRRIRSAQGELGFGRAFAPLRLNPTSEGDTRRYRLLVRGAVYDGQDLMNPWQSRRSFLFQESRWFDEGGAFGVPVDDELGSTRCAVVGTETPVPDVSERRPSPTTPTLPRTPTIGQMHQVTPTNPLEDVLRLARGRESNAASD